VQIWSNPEFVRHRRAELRRGRVITMLAVALLVCALVGLGNWAGTQVQLAGMQAAAQGGNAKLKATLERMERDLVPDAAASTYQTLFVIQTLLLTLWSLFACSQSISGERERKTWDFQRTTCLSPGEMVLGKLLGEPLMVYFITLCVMPVVVAAGIIGRYRLRDIAAAYALAFGAALFLGICGIAISMLLEARGRGIGSIAALALYGLLASTADLERSSFSGFAAISPIPGLMRAMERTSSSHWNPIATLFGREVPWVWISLLLWLTVGAWITLVLLRNVKKDYVEIRPLSRWQAVGCVAFLNFLIYAFFNPAVRDTRWDSKTLAGIVVGANTVFLFVMGIATLTPVERLRVWWRGRATGESKRFSESGLSWPWLVISAAVAYGLMVWGLLAWKNSLDYDGSALAIAAIQLATVTLFVARDTLFLQWCTLTDLKAPLFKGVLFLGLYYGTAAVLIGLCSANSSGAERFAESLLTPVGVFATVSGWHIPTAVFAGLAVQTGFIAMLYVAIGQRIQRVGSLVPVGAE
jgi:hypothetical protein